MKRVLWLVTSEIAARINPIDDWYWRCGYCKTVLQGGSFGLRAHTYVVHPHMKTSGTPAKEMNQWKNSSSSMASRPSLTVVSSSPTPASPATSARTD